MGDLVPPYLNDDLYKKYSLELLKAEKQEIKALKNYESAKEYTSLCREKVEKEKHRIEKKI